MNHCYIDKEHRAIADLVSIGPDEGRGLLITRINVPKASRGQGVARKLLAQILDDADREQVTLYLEILESGGLSHEQLEAWYTRHGFEQIKHRGLYRRLPATGRITMRA